MTVVLADVDTTKRGADNYLDGCDESRMLSLSEYLEIAEKCIARFNAPSVAREMLKDEDAISFVAEHLMYGTARWKPEGGRSFRSYLTQCARWAMTRWLSKLKSSSAAAPMSLNQNREEGDAFFYELIADPRDCSNESDLYWSDLSDKVEGLLRHPELSEAQSNALRQRYVDGKTLQEIGDDMGVSKQMANNYVRDGLNKLQHAYASPTEVSA